MSRFLLKILLLLIIIVFQFDTSIAGVSSKDTARKQLILLANVNMGRKTHDIQPFKAEAALNFAAISSGKFLLIPGDTLNKAVNEMLAAKDSSITPLKLAKQFKADIIFFMGINTIENMIRVDLTSINVADTARKSFGAGYASLRYKRMKDEKMLYDPELLTATMRAFAVVMHDSALFKTSDSNWVKPVPTLVIGGINYQSNPELPGWDIFLHKEVSSYDAVETIFDEIKQTKDFAVYDIQTRDSVYSLFNLVGIENFTSPTSNEVKSLSDMEVEYYITGNLERSEVGAILDLYLCQIKGTHLEIIKRKTQVVKEDSEEEYRNAIRKSVRVLMN